MAPTISARRFSARSSSRTAPRRWKWTAPTSFYTVRFPGAIDTKYFNDRIWINAELAPLDSKGKDNQNWVAVMDAYGSKSLHDNYRRRATSPPASRSAPC